jgi:hypothetical protein
MAGLFSSAAELTLEIGELSSQKLAGVEIFHGA